MAATEKGVWDVQEVRDKQLADDWSYEGPADPGSLYTWGFAEYGALGNNTGSNNFKSSPVQIGTEATWTALTINNTCSGIKSDGTIWTWGLNQHGQLGQGTNVWKSSPVQLPGTWGSIVTCHYSMAAVKTNGTMWVSGRNQQGQLGQNTGGYNVGRRSSPVQIPGTTWNPTQGATYMTSANNAQGIIHVKTDGSMWVWGQNQNAQLPLNGQDGSGNPAPYGMSSPVRVGTDTTWGYGEGKLGGNGDNSTFNIKTDGSLWAWGFNDDGALGVPGVSQSSPIQVGTDTNWAYVPPNGGKGEYNKFMAAIKTDGTLWTWGRQENGCLGHNEHGGPSGGQDPYSSPKQVGTDATWKTVNIGAYACYATKTDNTFWVWGLNSYSGKLGLNDRTNRSSPVQLPGTDWKRGSGGQYNGGGLKFPD
tara:strand:- start:45 stop:1298 length:1254 start_codon:yes stop_codon:yes gene_type:complete